MKLVPLSLRQANAVVAEHHRHHREARGCKFAIGCEVDGLLVGVAIVGRPVSRVLDDGSTLEVVRCCTFGKAPLGTCSRLYGRARRGAAALGYARVITYTLAEEGGASLRGAGWQPTQLRKKNRAWTTPARPRDPGTVDHIAKVRWQADCA